MWSLTLTERVHDLRAMLAIRHRDPEWVKMVDVTPGMMDWQLLRLRGRFAYSHPGLEIQ